MRPQKKAKITIREFFQNSGVKNHFIAKSVIENGGRPEGLYFIDKGYVGIMRRYAGQEPKMVAIYQPGDIFPLLWVFRKGHKDLMATALSDVDVRMASFPKFREFIARDPETLSGIVLKLINLFDYYVDLVKDLSLTKVRLRIVSRILFLAKRFGVRHGKEIIIKVPMSKTSFASSLAMARETANRELTSLESEGLISYRGKKIIIRSLKALQKEIKDV